MAPEAEVIGQEQWEPRSGGRRVFAASAGFIAVASVVGVVALAGRDDPSLMVPSPSPSTSVVQNPLTMGTRYGVNTDRDNDQFTYAITVRNSSFADVVVTGIELVPANGLTVVVGTVVSLAEFGQVWDPKFVPPASPDRTRIRPGTEVALLVRVAVDCAAPPAVDALRVHLRQGGVDIRQDITASATNTDDADLDLRMLPARSCG